MKKLTLPILLLVFFSGLSNAQSPWFNETRLSSITFEWDNPSFDERTYDNDDLTWGSSVLFATARFRLNDNLRFEAEVPFSYFGYENNNPSH